MEQVIRRTQGLYQAIVIPGSLGAFVAVTFGMFIPRFFYLSTNPYAGYKYYLAQAFQSTLEDIAEVMTGDFTHMLAWSMVMFGFIGGVLLRYVNEVK